MTADGKPHYERRFFAGDTKAQRLAEIDEKIKAAVTQAKYSDIPALTSEAESIKAEQPRKGGWKDVKTDMTEGEYWSLLDREGRRETSNTK